MLAGKSETGDCPAERFQIMISGKYKLRIMWGLKDAPRRFGEIRKSLLSGSVGSKQIAARVLSRELKQLAAMQMIERTDFYAAPPKVEYSLTPRGRSFIPTIADLHAWGARHLATTPTHDLEAQAQNNAAAPSIDG